MLFDHTDIQYIIQGIIYYEKKIMHDDLYFI